MITVFVTGNLGKDAVIRQAGKDNVCSFSVASSKKIKGEETVSWVSCSIWGKRGETLCQYLRKGGKVAVAGELSTREHDGKTYLECRVSEIDLMGGGNKSERKAEPEPEPSGATPGYTSHTGEDLGDLPF